MYFKVILNVFVGCCASAFLMEILMSGNPQSTNLITFLQFLFVSIHGFIFTMKFGTVMPQIPLKHYTLLIILFFITSVANNYVYALHVPSTLHMIIRSASSPASMLVSWYAKKKPPHVNKALGSLLISIGVALAMYGGAKIAQNDEGTFFYWSIGVAILLLTLFTGAFTGLQQEMLYAKYGKHPDEMLFYTNAIPLPFFLTIYPEMREIAVQLTYDTWLIIAVNILAQFYCMHSVHELATKETSVTVTLMLTLRKFISLLVSSLLFKNNLTVFHVLGTLLVVFGTYVYFDYFFSTGKQQRPISLKEKRY